MVLYPQIDQVASQPSGLSILSQRFNTCYPLEHTEELKEYVAVIGNNTCKVNSDKHIVTDDDTFSGWGWQICSEMVMPIGSGNSSMFEPQPFNFKSFAARCKKDFGVSPSPHWMTTYYGGQGSEQYIGYSCCPFYSQWYVCLGIV
ncbi:lysosomal Pro-X carboxypeptidase [Trifolium repens]|nr:lysosomal Pro-X carboxypeptidase [Trifolium repens]